MHFVFLLGSAGFEGRGPPRARATPGDHGALDPHKNTRGPRVEPAIVQRGAQTVLAGFAFAAGCFFSGGVRLARRRSESTLRILKSSSGKSNGLSMLASAP